MFKNYLKIAFRNFRKHKSFSLINLAGLAVGMACFILIMLYVQYELSFDRYHTNANRIYRVVAHQPGNVFLGTDHFAVTQAVLAKTLKDEYPEVLDAVTVDNSGNILISIGDQNFYEDGLLWADAQIFDIFDFSLLVGDPKTALAEPFSMLISEEYAHKYFGNENPIGKIVRYQDQHDFKITGVLQDVPKNSHFHFDLLVPFQARVAITEYKEQFTSWGNSSYYTYILTPQNFDQQAFEAKLPQLVKKYHKEDWRDENNPHRYYLEPLTKIHLHSHINFDIGDNNDIRYIYLLSGLALIILVIACINYMNLTTARASLRAREVGMRKVVGANRLQLLRQFIGESMLLTGAGGVLALALVIALLPVFAGLVERELTVDFLLQTNVIFSFLGAVLLVGFISGSYPALFLAAFKPVTVLKGEIQDSGRSRLRSALVIFQFSASVALIICTVAVQKQLNYIKSKKLGYNREQVLVMRMRDREARQKFDLIKNDLLENPNFIKVSASDHLPINVSSSTGLGWTEKDGKDGIQSYQSRVDHDFLDVFEIELVEGRNFSTAFSTDSTDAFLINEELRDLLGWESAVGKPFGRGDKADGQVVGVMKNFHMHSLRQEIKPLFFQLDEGWSGYASARIRTDDIPGIIDHMREVWQKYSPKYPFEYFFLNEQFNRMYATDEKLGEVFGYFTFLAVFIACLGLFGLASFTAERKSKEIGIRKVLGATVAQLLLLLSKDFTKLVIVANLIAWPVAWFAMNQWLQGFAYRTSLGWLLFLSTAAVALLIAWITVSFQTTKAALANPVEALRYE